ncbi:sugar-binding N-terminal domain containing protein [Nitzschia inconspicua]|uniref:Sugar-binding N-terminal domain containing protein n=1 Tax=Nitzschia inconspicua TaxID=303405 RepID=A0A9K3LUK8_9STRA|nr:sugar-binding N-terminal domain containing protein [Nitzschia inconspicua]
MKTKIIALDDDPTGSQTVHSCLLLTKWDVETLKIALLDDSSPLFFVLTNTRGMSSMKAVEVTREACQNLRLALADLKQHQSIEINPILVSRSDSTLRGHYPVETNVIAQELGPFDAHFLVPAFFEGGRITRNATHYLQLGDGQEIPCHETEFAKDTVFGYSTAYLPDYVSEKTKGEISAEQVVCFTLEDVREGCTEKLLQLHGNVCCVVDCEVQADLDYFSTQLKDIAEHHRRRFLFRSGASLLTSLAMLPPQPMAATEMSQYVKDGCPGVALVGSHVKKTTTQLEELLKLPETDAIEVDVTKIRSDEEHVMFEKIMEKIEASHTARKHPIIFTSREELNFHSQEDRLEFGAEISAFLMKIVQKLPPTTGFLISKGGITSNDVLSQGLRLRTSRVIGQILPGCSVVCCPSDHPRFPEMPVVIFPGNVGDKYSLATALSRLARKQ